MTVGTSGGQTLLERASLLALLHGLHEDVAKQGEGRLVLVGGEPGAGKTSLVRAFTSPLPPDTILWGGCDSLRTARPLGPLFDIAAAVGGPIADALAGAGREGVFSATLGLLGGPLPTVLVIEDLHWADEATLDLVSFLGRRTAELHAMLVLTYRSDEVGADHPLTLVLGELATVGPARIDVPPLSAAGVAALAEGHDIDTGELYRLTDGNPFFVTECLSAGLDQVPVTVRDAVLARRSRLEPGARMALDAVAVVPSRAELWLLEALGASPAGLDGCVEAGVLVPVGASVSFRHELARLAVLDVVPPARRRELHRRAMDRLMTPPTGVRDHARLAHHAAAAADARAVAIHAPLAADEALALGARREATAHLELALRHGTALPLPVRAKLWDRLGTERANLAQLSESVEAFEEAGRLFAEAGDEVARAATLVRLSGVLGTAGRQVEAVELSDTALEILEPLGRTSELADAYGQRCAHLMLARQLDDAERWGQRAMALAAELGDELTLARVRVQSGVAKFMSGEDAGLTRIREGIALAERIGRPDLESLGWRQLGSGGGEIRRYAEAVPALRRCIEHAIRHEMPTNLLYASAWLARCHLEQGRWDDSSELVSETLRSPRCVGTTEITACTVLGRLRSRRGDPDAWTPLDRALELARETGHLQRLWPVAAARAEAAWLEGSAEREIDLVDEVHALADRLGYPWAREELGFWLWRSTGAAPAPGVTPFSLHGCGSPGAAAEAWEKLGCPYEEALARADTRDVDEVRLALAALVALGAEPAARLVRARLRTFGATVPRGPNRATRENPGGLSDRELDVLGLVALGCTNAEIGDRLGIATKTVGHHVSHVLTKLGARSRAEAVALAATRGIPLEV